MSFSVFANPIKVNKENTIALMRVKYIHLPEIAKDKVLSMEQLEGVRKFRADDFSLWQIREAKWWKEA